MRIPGDSLSDLTQADIKRFFSKLPVDLNPESCWVWTSSQNADGRGRFQVKKFKWLAARLSWGIAYGEIPEELHILHTCDNPSCVNPLHLYPGTQEQNNLDTISRGRRLFKLNPEILNQLKSSPLSNGKLATLLQVHPDTIRSVRVGRTWKTLGTKLEKHLDSLGKSGEDGHSINGDDNPPINLPENSHV